VETFSWKCRLRERENILRYRYLYPEEIDIFVKCPYLFNTLKKKNENKNIVKTEIEKEIILDVIRSTLTYKTRRGNLPSWKRLRDITDRIIRTKGKRAFNLDKIIMPLNYWYDKYLTEYKYTIDIVGIDAIVSLSNREDQISSLRFSIPAFSIEQKGISIIIHSSLIDDYRINSLKNNIIIRTMIWGTWKQLGEQQTQSIYRFRVLNIQDDKIDYINIFQDKINNNIDIHELQYFLYGMSSRINRKNIRNDCNDCILFKRCSSAEE